MEPISFLRAPLRRWPVVVPFVVILAIVAVLIPYNPKGKYPANTWEAVSDLGLTPSAPGNRLGAKLSVKQLEFYVHQPAVIAAAAKAENVKVTNKLRNDVVITKSKKSTVTQKDKEAIVAVAVLQRTKPDAVNFTNAFVVALDAYTAGAARGAAEERGRHPDRVPPQPRGRDRGPPAQDQDQDDDDDDAPDDDDDAPDGAPPRAHAPRRPHPPRRDDHHHHEAEGGPQRAGQHVEHVEHVEHLRPARRAPRPARRARRPARHSPRTRPRAARRRNPGSSSSRNRHRSL